MKKMRTTRACELCKGEPTLYCASDDAFLCSHCDSLVHDANFLAARHLRRPLCLSCRTHLSPCPSCHEDGDYDNDDCISSSSTSSSSAAASSTSKRPRKSRRATGVPSTVVAAVLASRLRSGGSTRLRVVQKRYGVPAAVIAAAEKRFVNALRGRHVEKEGWAESH